MSVLPSSVNVSIDEDVVSVVVQPGAPAGVADTNGPLQSVPGGITLTAANNGQRFNNTGAAGAATVTLPPSNTIQPGWRTGLRVTAAFQFSMMAQGFDTILFDAFTTNVLGCAQIGSSIEVEYQGGGDFLVLPWVGPWG